MRTKIPLKNLLLGSASVLMLSAVAVHGQVIQGTQEYTLEVTAPEPVAITLASGTLPDAADGEAYDPPFDFKSLVTVSGGPSSNPVTAEDLDWAIVAGNLPFGLNLGAEGVLAGTPSDDGTFTFTVEAAFGDDFDTQEYTLAVASQEPDSFSFPPAFAAAGETFTAGPVLIEGFTSDLPIAISGDGNPQYSLDGGNTFTSDPGTIAPDTNVFLRLVASTTPRETREATLDVGGIEADLVVTTEDITPDTFAFASVDDASPSSLVTSQAQTITGTLGNVPISVSGDGSPAYSVDGGNSFTDQPGFVTENDEVRVRLEAAAAAGEERVATLNVGTENATFSVTTFDPQHYVPDPFPIASASGQVDTLVVSDPVTISGLEPGKSVDLNISGASVRAFSVNNGNFSATTRGVTNGDEIRFRARAPSIAGGSVTLVAQTLDPVGTVTRMASFNVTATAVPGQEVDAFAFNWQYDPQTYFSSFPGTTRSTEIITLSGGSGQRPIRFLQTSGHYNSGSLNRWPRVYGERIYFANTNNTITTSLTNDSNAVSWSFANDQFPNIVTDIGRNIRLRFTPDGGSNETYSVFCVASTCAEQIWTNSATQSDPRAADPFAFTAVTGAAQSTTIESAPVTVSWPARTAGATAPNIPISIAGAGSPQYRINGGSWRNDTTWVGVDSNVEVRLTSAGSPGTDRVATLSVGTTNADFTVRTADITTPDAFVLANVDDAEPDTLYERTVSVTGITTDVPISITGQGSPALSLDNGVTWIQSGDVAPNTNVRVRMTSADAFQASHTSTLDVNGVTDDFTVTTGDFNFSIASVEDVDTDSPITSEQIVLPAALGSVPISISGDGNPQYRINSGSFTSGSGTVSGGDTIEVRLTSSTEGETESTAMLTIDTVTAPFSVTTMRPVIFVGVASTGSTSSQLPPHEPGDLIIGFSHSPGSPIPTAPTGWTTISTRSQSGTISGIGARVAYRYATTSCSVQCWAGLGIWNSSSRVVYVVYRNAGNPNAVANGGNSSTVTYRQNNNFASAHSLTYMANRSRFSNELIPSNAPEKVLGMTDSGWGRVLLTRTAGSTSGFSGQSVSVGNRDRYATFVVRIPPE